jgi:hypothetical protein
MWYHGASLGTPNLTAVLDLVLFEPAFDCAAVYLFCLFNPKTLNDTDCALYSDRRAFMNFLEGSPGCYEFPGTFTGLGRGFRTFTKLEWTLLQVHRAGMDFTRDSLGCCDETRDVHRVGMDFTGTSPG